MLGVLVFVIGIWGFRETVRMNGLQASPLDIVYSTLELFELKFTLIGVPISPALEFARFAAPFLSVCTFYLVFASWFIDRVKLFWLKFFGGHVVICGMGYIGPVLAQNFYDRGSTVVVIEKDPNNHDIELFKDLGAIVLVKDATKRETLKSAHVENAQYVFSVTGDDGVNSEIATLCRELVSLDREKPLRCFVHIVDNHLCDLLKAKISGNVKLNGDNETKFRLDLFNIYQTAGSNILEKHWPFEAKSNAGGEGRIIVVGMGRMGQSLVVHATEKWQNQYPHDTGKPKFTIIDYKAAEKKLLLDKMHPDLSGAWDINPVSMDVNSSEFLEGDYLLKDMGGNSLTSDGKCDASIVYICFDDSALGLTVALQLNEKLNDPKRGLSHKNHVPIIVRTIRKAGITGLLQNGDEAVSFENIVGFPIIEHTRCADILQIDIIDKLAYEIHNQYVMQQQREGVTSEDNSSMRNWDSLSKELQESNIQQAAHIKKKLKEVNCGISLLVKGDKLFAFSNQEVELLAKMEHERWMAEKINAGYKYGEEKNENLKTHPCIMDWILLPWSEQEKDRNTIRTLPSILEKIDLTIERLPKQQGVKGRQRPKHKLLKIKPIVK